MKSHVIMFQSRFAAKIKSGLKATTIRLPRKRPISPGDRLSLREWKGKPYRSKQRILLTAWCTKVEIFEIFHGGIDMEEFRFRVGDTQMVGTYRRQVAVADGFHDEFDMIGWFSVTHGLPFAGIRISWEVPK